jgi:type IX secretion system PorP/SprF family membrane protein
MKNTIITTICLISLITGLKAQDIHFSQFNNAPMMLNPALTGAFNGNHRVTANYKHQWYDIEKAYQTYGLSYDLGLLRNSSRGGFLGLGLQFYNDVAGLHKMGLMQENISVSYHLPVSKNHLISAGILGGFSQRRISDEHMQWASQYDPSYSDGFNPALTPGEPAAFGNMNFGDFSAGILWNYSKPSTAPSENNAKRVQLGLAVYHINRPKQTYYDVLDKKMFMKMAVHATSYIGFWNTGLALIPSAVWYHQGPSNEILAGTLLRIGLSDNSTIGTSRETALAFGGYYRVNDAVIAAAQLEIHSFLLSFSYDVNISDLSGASKYKGGMEFALRYFIPSAESNKCLF